MACGIEGNLLYLEMGAITDRISRQSGCGSALIFNNVKGHSMSVTMNVFGSVKRIAMALDSDSKPLYLYTIAARLENYLKQLYLEPTLIFF